MGCGWGVVWGCECQRILGQAYGLLSSETFIMSTTKYLRINAVVFLILAGIASVFSQDYNLVLFKISWASFLWAMFLNPNQGTDTKKFIKSKPLFLFVYTIYVLLLTWSAYNSFSIASTYDSVSGIVGWDIFLVAYGLILRVNSYFHSIATLKNIAYGLLLANLFASIYVFIV